MRLLFVLLTLACLHTTAQQSDSLIIKKIFDDALQNGKGYTWLAELCSDIGHRLSGSPQEKRAVEWMTQKMKEAGADTVWLQEVKVPHWVRGKGNARIIHNDGRMKELSMLALGGSVATPKDGITAEVVEVYDFDELKKLGRENIEGKIVFYNHPFDQRSIDMFDEYGKTVRYRWAGPSEAARYGAVATLCRSLNSAMDDYPHTGAMRYNDSLPKLPCAVISPKGAEELSALLRKGEQIKFRLYQECELRDSVTSYNVLGEIRGSKYPDEYLVVGAHLDSWDVGQGAHDDGAGIVQTLDVVRIFKNLGIRPDRTIRAIGFANEENGLRGGTKYADEALRKKEKHVFAIESDAGGFVPTGFGMEMEEAQKEKVRQWAPLFLPYGIYDFSQHGDGADISRLENQNVPRMGLQVSSHRYFEIHHAESDTFEKVNHRELHLGAAAMAAMLHLISTYGL